MRIESTMQHGNLGVARLLRHALEFGSGTKVISQSGGVRIETTMQACATRAARLGAALAARGLCAGDVVATLGNAEIEHFEATLGVPGYGMVLHPLNVRMHDEDLEAAVRSCGDRALIASRDQLERLERFARSLADTAVRLVVVVGEGAASDEFGLPVETVTYDDLLASVPAVGADQLTDPEETGPASICHTGGTTGRPKTVVYSHRSIWLQAQGLTMANSLGLSRKDTLLAAVPLYHVNGWGLPFGSVMASANLILPGNVFRADRLDAFIEDCGVTIAAGVPTIWTDLLEHRKAVGRKAFRTLSRLATGGAIVPGSLVDAMAQWQVDIVQAWGMTETSSMSVVGRVADTENGGRGPVGYPMPGLSLRVVDTEGRPIEPGSGKAGEIQIRGDCVTGRYLGLAETDAFDGGWLRTGDIGTVDKIGRLALTDRLKDAIKSGGEWIAAPVLEDALRGLPGILDAAVIAMPDPRFQERPLAVVVCEDGELGDVTAYGERLREKVPSWWLPDGWAVIPALPRTGLGKPDKAALRTMQQTGALTVVRETPRKQPIQSKEKAETTHEY